MKIKKYDYFINEGLIKSCDYDIIIRQLNNFVVKYDEKLNIKQTQNGLIVGVSKKIIKYYIDFFNILKICGYVISSYSYDDKKRINKSPVVNDILYDIYTNINFTIIKKFDIENTENIEYLYHVTDKKKHRKNIEKRINSKIKQSNRITSR